MLITYVKMAIAAAMMLAQPVRHDDDRGMSATVLLWFPPVMCRQRLRNLRLRRVHQRK
jgi:hypothetical protein